MTTLPLTLVLDAASGGLDLVLHEQGTLLVAENWRLEHSSTEVLAPALAQIMRLIKRPIGEIKKIACVHGPGSFTGIRLTLATAQALRRTNQALLAPLNALELLALEAVRSRVLASQSRLVVATYARRNLVHRQIFLVQEKGRIDALSSVELVAPHQVLVPDTFYVGDALQRYPELVANCDQERVFDDIRRPSPETLILASSQAQYADSDLEPYYVRECDALDNLERLASRQGITDSRERLEELLERSPLACAYGGRAKGESSEE